MTYGVDYELRHYSQYENIIHSRFENVKRILLVFLKKFTKSDIILLRYQL